MLNCSFECLFTVCCRWSQDSLFGISVGLHTGWLRN